MTIGYQAAWSLASGAAGLAMAILSLWTLLTDKDYSGWTRDWTER